VTTAIFRAVAAATGDREFATARADAGASRVGAAMGGDRLDQARTLFLTLPTDCVSVIEGLALSVDRI
jgi:hypothetical protein